MLNVALLGAGRIGRFHAGIVARHPAARLAAVFDVRRESAEEVAVLHGATAAESAEEALADPGIDAVLIATSTDTHAAFLEAAAKAGKAVFCEKPIDLDIRRVDACRAAVAGCKGPIQIGFNRRFDPGHRAAYDALRSGEIGRLHQVIITSRDPGIPPRAYLESAGGLLRDMTIHDFDLARFMLGEEPVEVFALAGALGDPSLAATNEIDSAIVTLRTASGTMAVITNSRSSVYGYDQRVELMGDAGMVLSDNRRPHGLLRFTKATAGAPEPLLDFFVERYREAFERQFAAFVRAAADGTPAEVGFEDGRRALLLAEAAYESLRTKAVARVAT